MIEIKAKDDATIQLINNEFPLGQRNRIKIFIEDEVIKSKLELQKSGQCPENKNLFTYGYFDKKEDIKYVQVNNADVRIISGVFGNCSRCLAVDFLATDSCVSFTADRDSLQTDTKYKFSFICTDNSIVIKSSVDDLKMTITKTKEKGWYLYTSNEFTVSEVTDFNISLCNNNNSNSDEENHIYVDNLSLFNTDDEILGTPNDIRVEISVINPRQNTIIKDIIKWESDDNNNIDVILYFPPITVVDYQDCITCKVKIFERLAGKYKTFGDINYTCDIDTIYESELFNLQGYILPINIDIKGELIVENI